MCKTTRSSQVQVSVKVEEVMVVDKSDEKDVATEEIEAVEVTETSVDDKAGVEAVIRRALEKGKAIVGEEPQMQIGWSELVAPKKLMIFELKWPMEVLDIKQELPEVEEEETPVDEGLEKEDMFPEPCIMAFCYENHCLIYHLVPPVAEPNSTTYAGTSIFISQDVLGMLQRPENIFVGDGIQKEVEEYCNVQVTFLKSIDVLHHTNPVFNNVSGTQNLTTLGSRVMNMKIVPNMLDRHAKWEDPNLAVQQVENLVIETFTLAKVGTALLGGSLGCA
ncbi:cyclin-D1-1 [Trifolium pratense]|uniref:Cyclin-D1-1 n=1 Tax=Trifolium pratense TaxID=57577 RepID=A0A2K3N1H0_TRIPR|nr:cyclin-D1-1 [Trifolium pratense]